MIKKLYYSINILKMIKINIISYKTLKDNKGACKILIEVFVKFDIEQF
jgi:hypothetical protein